MSQTVYEDLKKMLSYPIKICIPSVNCSTPTLNLEIVCSLSAVDILKKEKQQPYKKKYQTYYVIFYDNNNLYIDYFGKGKE